MDENRFMDIEKIMGFLRRDNWRKSSRVLREAGGYIIVVTSSPVHGSET